MTQEEQIYLQKFAQEFKNRKGVAPERQHLHYALKKYREEQPSLTDVKETGMPEFMQPQPQPAEAVSTAVKPTAKSTEEKKLALEKAWELIGKGWEEAGRPHYAIANVIKFAQDPETYYKTHNIESGPYSFRAGVGQSFWEGLTKKEKGTVSESFDKALTYMPEEWWVLRGTFKTIGDVSPWVTDPRYWFIGKAIGVVAKQAIKASPEKIQRFLLKERFK
ncbi:hypothetical protein KAU34_06310, partial [candidate division WOR-3 bacterium]|nr:hypothetical protein [candidate division WOR-3 bacterium]